MSNATQNHFGRRVLSGLTALGSGQTTAFSLLNSADHQFTTVGGTTAAVLPSARLPSSVTVFNGGANNLSVYPPVGGTINGGTVNAAVTVGAGTGAELFAADTLTWYTAAAATVPTTGLELDQFASKITSDTAISNTFTCDLSVSNWHTCTLGATNTIAVANGVTGQQFTIVLVQDGSGSRTVTWFSTIKWAGGSPPTLTTTINKADIFTFKQTGAGAYYGMIAGQNF